MFDRVFETSSTTGTGALTLAGAVTGYRSFGSVFSVGDTFPYVIEAIDAAGAPTGEWECGIGTYSATNTLTRTTVTSSSNSGAAVNLSAGTKAVFVGATRATDFPQSTDTTTSIGLYVPPNNYQKVTYAPTTSTSQPIRFVGSREMESNTSQAISGAGHLGGGIDRYIQTGTGDPGLAIAHESKFENNNASATITLAKNSENQLAANAGTITYWAGVTAQILANAGTITTAVMHDADVPSNSGTITTLIDYWSRDVSGRSGITTKYGFRQDDPGKRNVSASPWISSAVQSATPTNGGTTTITALKDWLLLNHGSTIASHTIAFPASSTLIDGQAWEISTLQEITALTITCSGASFIIWTNGTTLSAGMTLRFRWDATNGYLRLMSMY